MDENEGLTPSSGSNGINMKNKKDFIRNFVYHDKTVMEWEQIAETIQGLDKDGNPAWYEPMANATWGRTSAKMKIMMIEKVEIQEHIKAGGHIDDLDTIEYGFKQPL